MKGLGHLRQVPEKFSRVSRIRLCKAVQQRRPARGRGLTCVRHLHSGGDTGRCWAENRAAQQNRCDTDSSLDPKNRSKQPKLAPTWRGSAIQTGCVGVAASKASPCQEGTLPPCAPCGAMMFQIIPIAFASVSLRSFNSCNKPLLRYCASRSLI